MKILKIILNIIIILILVSLIFTLITSRTSFVQGIRSFVVVTGSMEPTILTQSVIYTMPKSSYQKGNIITFKEFDKSITHRIVGTITKNGQKFFQTKGDANNASDTALIRPDQIQGNVFLTIPYFGYVINFAKTIPGFIFLVVIPTIIYIGYEIVAIKKELEKEFIKKHQMKEEVV